MPTRSERPGSSWCRPFRAPASELLGTGKLILLNNQIDTTNGTVQLKGRFSEPAAQPLAGPVRQRAPRASDNAVDALTVPAAAIQRGQTGTYVYVVNDDGKTVQTQNVNVVQMQDGMAIVDKGLRRQSNGWCSTGSTSSSPASRSPRRAPARGARRCRRRASGSVVRRGRRRVRGAASERLRPASSSAHRHHAAHHRRGWHWAGMAAFPLLPVAPLPQVDFPTISVSAHLPGASPDTMASTVASRSSASRADRRRHADDLDQRARLDLITLQFELARSTPPPGRAGGHQRGPGQLPPNLPTRRPTAR